MSKPARAKNRGDQDLIAGALEAVKVLQSLNQRTGQLVKQLQPVEIVAKALVGLYRPGEGMGDVKAVINVWRPFAKLHHRLPPLGDRVPFLRGALCLFIEPFRAERHINKGVEKLIEGFSLRALPERIPDKAEPGVAHDHAGGDGRARAGDRDRCRAPQHRVAKRMDALVLAAVAIVLSMQAAGTRPCGIERRQRRKRQILLGQVLRLHVVHADVDFDPCRSNLLASPASQRGHCLLNAPCDRVRIVPGSIGEQDLAAALPAVRTRERHFRLEPVVRHSFGF